MPNPTLVGTTSHANTVVTSSSFSNSHTVPSRANLLTVLVWTFNGTFPSSVTWNGTSMVGANRLKQNPTAGYLQFEPTIWYIWNPTPGTGNIAVTLPAGDFISIAGYNIQDAASPLVAAFYSGNNGTTSVSFNCPSENNALMIINIVSDGNNQVFTPNGSQSVIFSEDNVANTSNKMASSQIAGSTPTVSVGYTVTVTDSMGLVGLVFPSQDGTGGGGGGTHSYIG